MKFKRKLSIMISTTLLVGVLSGCHQNDVVEDDVIKLEESNENNKEKKSSGIRKITDMVGREVEIPEHIESVANVGSVGVLNGFVFLFGEGDKISNGLPPKFTKTDRWKYHSIMYPSLTDKPIVEDGSGTVTMEEIVEISPDVVFTMDEKTATSLEDKGLKTVVLEWKKPEDMKKVVSLLGEIFEKEDIAKEYSIYFDESLKKISEIAEKIPEDKRVRVLNTSLESLSLPHVVADWWIEAAGGVSMSKDLGDLETKTYNLEQLHEWNPDILIVSSDKDEDIAYEDEAFNDIKAVQDKRVYTTPIFAHVWANRTIEQPLTVMWAAKVFYPEEFKDLNMTEELKNFSSKFFKYNLTDEECKDILKDIE